RFVSRIVEKMGNVKGQTLGVLGLAFKADTDELREAKSLEIIAALQQQGAKIKVYDPIAMENAKGILKDVVYCRSAYETAEGCDAVVVVTDWNEFKLLNLEKLRETMKNPVIFDGRNIYSPEKVRKSGLEYVSIGRR
ncbi:MAG: UDP-glucose 6-dehydrogenase, partial [Candidatus Sumerlaeaceae bacterium]|nr:UDP-glucose 6-dehydrogenase [Candidatus Sumerlaeaceae bacterium]